LAAVRADRRVCVYGDYDVDGVTGTALLLQCLRLAGARAEVYVPHRLEEGYGLNAEALRQIAAGGASLVVTVDCGIASVAEAAEVPLHDENRILVRYGLTRLRQAPCTGLKALLEAARIPAGSELRAGDVGYRIAPRLNAAGRLGCARLVVDLLTTTRPEQAAD